eukprot:TRINITY_DN2290_c0_g2_i1.p1 TRINITY_DN2290_c0_g2~~TRINITY_DN2290_c0_g2_i1.p1  ORF type:complete len:474 (+),score=139.93 TRINITY_DN2290_c0_g2_i1:172-1593(+)
MLRCPMRVAAGARHLARARRSFAGAAAAPAPKSVPELKRLLQEAGVATSDCFDKEDLVDRYRRAQEAGLFNGSCENNGDCETCPRQGSTGATNGDRVDTPEDAPAGPLPTEVVVARDAVEATGVLWSSDSPVLLMVYSDSPAARAGLERYVGHRLLAVGGRQVVSTQQAIETVRDHSPGSLALTFSPEPDWEASAAAGQQLSEADRALLRRHAAGHGVRVATLGTMCSACGLQAAKLTPRDVVTLVRHCVAGRAAQADSDAQQQRWQQQEQQQQREEPPQRTPEPPEHRTAEHHRRPRAAASEMSVRDLKQALEKAGVATSDCVDKDDLLKRYSLAKEKGMLDGGGTSGGTSGGGGGGGGGKPQAAGSADEAALRRQSVGQLKRSLEERGIATSDCFEKEDLVQRHMMARAAGHFDKMKHQTEPDQWPSGMPPPQAGEVIEREWVEPQAGQAQRGGCGGGGCGRPSGFGGCGR